LVPTAAVEVALEQLCIAWIKRQDSSQALSAPSYSLHKHCGRFGDVVLAVPLDKLGWHMEMFEPTFLWIIITFK
jgi:hypothetical protein